ncbi:MAG: patatin-like phospholipase family protein [Halioglobus sp.]|nr:patatin-like phospholipase family protein [Halioglobus sp.]
MAFKALSVYLGREAARRIGREGWSADLFSLLLGASGGPKWFILARLDRLLFGDFLQRSEHTLSVLGSSIGSWRHACLAMPDPLAALDALEAAYLHQHYASKPTAAEVSAVSREILRRVLGDRGAQALASHPRIHSHIVTARGRGPAGASSNPMLATGMVAAGLGNAVSRRLLGTQFQRVVFHSQEAANPGLALNDFATRYCRLREDNVAAALHASGAIPFVLAGERDIAGAPPGQYWDGGIIDYHFNLGQYCGEGLMLYPHFSANVVPGWFDKLLPWRKAPLQDIDKLVLLCPSEAFTADLPHGKIPDRTDFNRLPHEERVRYWEQCIARASALAEEFGDLIQGSDPLRGATLLG